MKTKSINVEGLVQNAHLQVQLVFHLNVSFRHFVVCGTNFVVASIPIKKWSRKTQDSYTFKITRLNLFLMEPQIRHLVSSGRFSAKTVVILMILALNLPLLTSTLANSNEVFQYNQNKLFHNRIKSSQQ